MTELSEAILAVFVVPKKMLTKNQIRERLPEHLRECSRASLDKALVRLELHGRICSAGPKLFHRRNCE